MCYDTEQGMLKEIPHTLKSMKNSILNEHKQFRKDVIEYTPNEFLNSLVQDCYDVVYHTIERKIGLRPTKVSSLECFFTRTLASQLWHIFGEPKAKVKSYVNNFEKKIYSLCYVWECSSKEAMNKLFPGAFEQRIYSNSEGAVDFINEEHLAGGILVPRIDTDHVTIISYDWKKQVLGIQFYYNKRKCRLIDGKILFREIH